MNARFFNKKKPVWGMLWGLMICLPGLLQAQAPQWQVNPAQFSGSMSYTGFVIIDHANPGHPDDMIGAFYNDQVRGVAHPVWFETSGQWIFFMVIYGNTNNKEIQFRYYNQANGEVYPLYTTVAFGNDLVVGSAFEPRATSDVPLTEAKFHSFFFPGQLHSEISDGVINIVIPPSVDLGHVSAHFEASVGALVKVGDEVQFSGQSYNDFTQQVTYTVRSGDEQTTQTYQLHTGFFEMEAVVHVLVNGEELNPATHGIFAVLDENISIGSPFVHEETGSARHYFVMNHFETTGIVRFAYAQNNGPLIFFPGEFPFQPGSVIGTEFNPVILSDPEITDSDLINFSLEGQKGETIFSGQTIKVIFDKGMDIGNLEAHFELTPGARLFINDSIQYSGFTRNDYRSEVELKVKNPGGDVSKAYQVKVMIADYTRLEASSLVTPNGDGINDTWMVKEVERFSDSEFTIFDFMGRIVFESTGYDNSWEGYFNNSLLPVGTYYYTVKSPDGSLVRGVISLVY